MKKTINGIRYDTDKATLITMAQSKEKRGSPHYWQELFYLSPRRTHTFLQGEGGFLTAWGRPHKGGGRTSGKGIKPLTDREAQEWLDHYSKKL